MDVPVALPDDQVRHRQRQRVDGIVQWLLLGFFLGGLGPLVPLVLTGAAAPFVAFVLGSTLIGCAGGLVLGLLDPPRFGFRDGHRIDALLAALVHGTVALFVGSLWASLAGAGGGLATYGVLAWNLPPGAVGLPPALVLSMGAGMGALGGTPGVVVFSVVRAALQRLGWPTWPALPAAALVTLMLGLLAFWATLSLATAR